MHIYCVISFCRCPLLRQADLPGIVTINALQYATACSRLSYFVVCRRMMRNGKEGRRGGVIQHFLLVKAVNKPTLRLAICNLYAPLPSLCNGTVYVADASEVERLAEAMPLGVLDAVLVSAEPRQERGREYYKTCISLGPATCQGWGVACFLMQPCCGSC